MSSVVWKDLGWNAIQARVDLAGKTRVETGLVGPAADELYPGRSDVTVGEVGIINEYGTDDIPSRPWLRGTLRDRLNDIKAALIRATADIVFRGVTGDVALDRVGYATAEMVKRTIERGVPPGNAPATVAKKGFDHPLMELGYLLKAITHRLVRAAGGIVDAGAAIGDYEEFHVDGGGGE